MGILAWIIVGAIAGLVANRVVSHKGMGLVGDVVVGILGAFLGGWLAGLVGFTARDGTFAIVGLVAAFAGAVILLFAFRALHRGGILHT